LLNNVASVYIANSVCCSSDTILVSTVHMDVFLQLLSCGCCVDIQHYAVYNIVSKAARLYKLILHCCCDVILLFLMPVTTAVSLHVSAVNCNLGVVIGITYGRIILNWIFRNWDLGVWTGSNWLRKGTGGGHLGLR